MVFKPAAAPDIITTIASEDATPKKKNLVQMDPTRIPRAAALPSPAVIT